jgi:hypothetical protein
LFFSFAIFSSAAVYFPSMTRRLGLASLAVVVFAFAGAAAGPARSLQSLGLVVSVEWRKAPEQIEHETLAPRVPQPAPAVASLEPRSAGFRPFPVERWLFQRPPPASA